MGPYVPKGAWRDVGVNPHNAVFVDRGNDRFKISKHLMSVKLPLQYSDIYVRERKLPSKLPQHPLHCPLTQHPLGLANQGLTLIEKRESEKRQGISEFRTKMAELRS